MRKFRYDNPSQHGKIERTEDQIFDEYWNFWREKVVAAGMSEPNFFDPRHRDLCIEDWCTENWAWEITEPLKDYNPMGCSCSRDEWYDCDMPCGYKEWEKARK